jgi:ParB/RepB/Spo0J family partition protein
LEQELPVSLTEAARLSGAGLPSDIAARLESMAHRWLTAAKPTVFATAHVNGKRPDPGLGVCARNGSGGVSRQATAPTTVVLLSIGEIAESPASRNSRIRYDDVGVNELAASIRQHGVLQPILVRPVVQEELSAARRKGDGCHGFPSYLVIAGNRRLRAARQVGLTEMPCIIRVTDADSAFVLNVVENLQRRGLSGRERVRAISLLSRLANRRGRLLGVREISRLTGLSPATISLWLRIDCRPALKAALEAERLDIGRAMKLVSAPAEALDILIAKARLLTLPQLAAEVSALKRDPRVISARRSAANERHALASYRALTLVDDVRGPVRKTLERLHKRLNWLLAQ